MDAEISQIIANTIKLGAETVKLNKETFWHPAVIGVSLVFVSATFAKLFL
jgi:hypothetical protein